jgi:hypothetical protein
MLVSKAFCNIFAEFSEVVPLGYEDEHFGLQRFDDEHHSSATQMRLAAVLFI